MNLERILAILTDGIIYSDDGAWDYSRLPIGGMEFKTEYLNTNNIRDTYVKDNVEKWLSELKKEYPLKIGNLYD